LTIYWFDAIEDRVRSRVRDFIEAWSRKSSSLRAYQRRTKAADALIAGAYLSGTNTRRVRRALAAVFAGPVGKDVVSRAWRKVKGDWDAWNARPLGEEPIARLILDGTGVRVRLDRRATSVSFLLAPGVRGRPEGAAGDPQHGGESEAAWRALLADLVKRGLRTPELIIADGAPGLEKALAALGPMRRSSAARFTSTAISLFKGSYARQPISRRKNPSDHLIRSTAAYARLRASATSLESAVIVSTRPPSAKIAPSTSRVPP
jgi:hypothetical protein